MITYLVMAYLIFISNALYAMNTEERNTLFIHYPLASYAESVKMLAPCFAGDLQKAVNPLLEYHQKFEALLNKRGITQITHYESYYNGKFYLIEADAQTAEEIFATMQNITFITTEQNTFETCLQKYITATQTVIQEEAIHNRITCSPFLLKLFRIAGFSSIAFGLAFYLANTVI